METIEKNELFEKINELVNVLPLCDAFEEKYKDILDKHNVQNVNSNVSEKISDIKDPFERSVVALFLLEKIDIEDVNVINHIDLLKLFMMLNRSKMNDVTEKEKESCLVKANDYFDNYITKFK